jgi:TolB-like protein
MLLPALLLIVSANPEPVKVASPGFRVVDISAEKGAFYSEHFANRMLAAGISIVTQREISEMIGLERQKQLLGCSEGNECMVELANALGVNGILLGDVAKLGSRFQISLKVIDAGNGQALSVKSFRANDEEGLIDGLSSAAVEMAIELQRRFGRVPIATAPPSGGVSKSSWWIPAVGGALAVGAGALCLGFSRGDYAQLDPAVPGTLSEMQANELANRGKGLQTAAVVLFAVGAAAAVSSAGIAVFGTETRVMAAVTPEGGVFSVAGSFP